MTELETYRHYKGGLYVKLHEAMHADTEEIFIVYACAVRGGVFIRPKSAFEETITIDGKTIPRFERLHISSREAAYEFLKTGTVK